MLSSLIKKKFQKVVRTNRSVGSDFHFNVHTAGFCFTENSNFLVRRNKQHPEVFRLL